MRLLDCRELVLSESDIYEIIASSIGIHDEWMMYYRANQNYTEKCELDIGNKKMIFSRENSYHGSPNFEVVRTIDLTDDQVDKLIKLASVFKLIVNEISSVVLKLYGNELNSIEQIN